MGSWNGTCAVSNLHITSGTDVAVFMLLENKNKKTFCYGNAIYDVCPLPFYGKYNDYGAVDDCTGLGVDIVVEAIKSRLYEFGQGPNSSHDLEVNKSNFNIDMLFEADHEDRLGIQELPSWSNDQYQLNELARAKETAPLTSSQQFELDRLAAKLTQTDTFRRVTHVIIHGAIFKDIMEKYHLNEYIGAGLGDTGYSNSYHNIYFKDVVASITEYIDKKKKSVEDIKAASTEVVKWALELINDRGTENDWNSPNLATKWLASAHGGSQNPFGLIHIDECIRKYVAEEDWDTLESFVKEVLTGMWVNNFMSDTRKVWTQQCGQGSQSDDHGGYNLLIQSMSAVLKAEKAEYEDDNED